MLHRVFIWQQMMKRMGECWNDSICQAAHEILQDHHASKVAAQLPKAPAASIMHQIAETALSDHSAETDPYSAVWQQPYTQTTRGSQHVRFA